MTQTIPPCFGILGSTGRMGQEIIPLLSDQHIPYHTLLRTEYSNATTVETFLERCQTLIDFSLPQGVAQHSQWLRHNPRPYVVGVTNLPPAEHATLTHLAQHMPVVFAPNTSVVVAMLEKMTRDLSHTLGTSYDVTITDGHHRHKKDAPSGTAHSLYTALSPQHQKTAQILSWRMGPVIGEHTLHWVGPYDTLTLTHRVTHRRLFAQGAIAAALWAHTQPPGFYTMQDVYALPPPCQNLRNIPVQY